MTMGKAWEKVNTETMSPLSRLPSYPLPIYPNTNKMIR